MVSVFFSFIDEELLLTQVKLLNNVPISLNVNLLEVIKETASLTNQHKKRALCSIIFLVALQVLGKVSDTVGK